MRIFIDTNVLISAALNSKSTSAKAFTKAVLSPNTGIVCHQNIEELRRIFNRKFPNKIALLERFISIVSLGIEIVPMPSDKVADEEKIRDVADRHIFRAAIHSNADVILTGDKDFLESGILKPKILNPTQFLEAQ